MPLDLGLGERAKRNDQNSVSPSILDRLSDEALTHLSAPQSGRYFGMVDNNKLRASATISHLRFHAIDYNPVTSLRRAIFPLDLPASQRSWRLQRFRLQLSHLAALAVATFEHISVPASKAGGSFISRYQKGQKRCIRFVRGLNRVVGQDEFR